jgi:hypothetical protein
MKLYYKLVVEDGMMDGSALLILLILIGITLLLVAYRVRLVRRRPPPADRPAFNLITPEQIAAEYNQLQQNIARLAGPPRVLDHHGYPDALQWLLLLQQAPSEANDLHNALQKQFAIRGAFAELATINSLIAYAAAQQYLETHGPLAMPYDAQPRPHATLESSYPNEQEWYRLLIEDRKEAMRVLHQLELKRAQLGLSAPPTLEVSYIAFQRADRRLSAQTDQHEPSTE